MDDDTTVLATITIFCVGILAAGIGGAIYQGKKHEEFLRQHGCQLLTEAETGRRVYCGKACSRPEKVYVYDCIDGTKTEVR